MGPAIPPAPPVGTCAPCLPTAHRGLHLTIYEYSPSPHELWMQEGASAWLVQSQDPCTCCVFFQGCFPRESQGSLVSLSKTAAPLDFPQSTHHSPVEHFLYTFSVPLYAMLRILFCLDLRVYPWHLGQCLVPHQSLLIEWMKIGTLFLFIFDLLCYGICPFLTQLLYRNNFKEFIAESIFMICLRNLCS